MSKQLVRNRIFLIKAETTSGTDAAPTVSSNAVEVSNFKRVFKADVLGRDNIRGNISQITPVIGRRYAEISFDVEFKGSGTQGVAPMLDAILRAASLVPTTSASSVVYKPNSVQSVNSTATAYIYNLDSGSCVLEKFTGCVLDISLKIAAGQIVKASVKGDSLYNAPADAALPSAPTYEATIPPVVQNALFAYNSNSVMVIKEFDLDLGNDIAIKDDISSANGVKGFTVTGRKPKGKFSPEAELTGVYNFPADWSGSAPQAVTVQIGSVAGNTIIITAPKVQITDIQDGNDSGILTKEISFSLGLNAGDDEFSISFQ